MRWTISYVDRRRQQEQRELTLAQLAKIQQLRGLADAACAEVEGADLPAELHYYERWRVPAAARRMQGEIARVWQTRRAARLL